MFIVETGEGLSNSIAYASPEELDAYASVRMGHEHLDVGNGREISDTLKVKALVSASDLIDKLRWSGSKSNKSQNMKWPRCNAINTCDECECPCSTSIPYQIKESTILLASAILRGDIDLSPQSKAAKIKSASLMDISLEFSGSGAVIDGSAGCGSGISTVSSDKYYSVRHLINCFLDSSGTKFRFNRGY